MLVLSRKRSEQIIINGNIRVTVLEIRSGRVRLGFSAPPEISILRSELPLREEWHANDEATAGDAATAIVDLPAAGHDTTQTLLEV